MRRLFFAAALGMTVLCNATAFTPIDPIPETALEKERKQVLAWMDGLGLADVKDLKFVRVQLGSSDIFAGDDLTGLFQYGFLLEDRGRSFKILHLDLAVTVHERTPPDTPPHARVDHEPADLFTYVNSAQNNPKEWEKDGQVVRFRGRFGGGNEMPTGAQVSIETRQLFLAWACERRGLKDASAKLFQKARAASTDPLTNVGPNIELRQPAVGSGIDNPLGPPGNGSSTGKPPAKPSLQERVARNLAEVETARAFLAFRDDKVARSDILQRFEHILTHYPGCEQQARVGEMALHLRLMVHEDNLRAQQQQQRKPFAQLSEREQLAELVYLLRDQTAAIDENGQISVFHDAKGSAALLAARGYEAVPVLLAILDDPRPTRCPQMFFAAESVLTIGNCAEMILGQISGIELMKNMLFADVNRDFRNFRPTGDMELLDNAAHQSIYALAANQNTRLSQSIARTIYTAWYKDLQQKGEKRLLIEATARGDLDSLEQGRRLQERYPNDALPSLIAAARTGQQHLRSQFVDMIRTIEGEESTAFLLAEVKEGPFASQVSAAEGLLNRGRPEGLAAMIAEWHDANPRLYLKNHLDRISRRNAGRLIEFLAGSGEPEGIAALAKNLRKRPVDVRVDVLSITRFASQQATEAKYWDALEALLIGCLDDTEERRAYTYQSDMSGANLSDPRVCDVAAAILNDLFPDKYSFDVGALPTIRNRRIVELNNIWRQSQHLAALPIPQPRSFAAVPEKKVRPLLEKYLANPAQRPQTQAEIEKLGVGAFWPVLDYRDGLTRKEFHELIDGLAKKLACTVTDVQFAAESLQPDAALRARFEAMKNMPLDRKSFLQAIEATVKALPDDVHAVQFCAQRAGDNTGFILTIDLLSRQRAASAFASNRNGENEFVNIAQLGGPGGRFIPPPAPNWPDFPADLPGPPKTGNSKEPEKKLFYSSRIRFGMGRTSDEFRMQGLQGNQFRFGMAGGMVFPIIHSSAGEHVLPSAWSPNDLVTSVDQTLRSDPGEPIEVNIRFSRDVQPTGRERFQYR